MLASAFAVDDVSVADVIASEPAVRSRRRVALVVTLITLTATAAPILTLSPPAEAFESRSAPTVSVAEIVALPVTVMLAPAPIVAVVTSFAIAIETDGLMATPPSLPALSSVTIV